MDDRDFQQQQESEFVLAAIVGGDHDDFLDAIGEAIRERRKTLAAAQRFTLKRGDTVRFSGNIRPKYLIGLPVTVEKINAKSIVVNCPDDISYGRFRASRGVRCPLELIEA